MFGKKIFLNLDCNVQRSISMVSESWINVQHYSASSLICKFAGGLSRLGLNGMAPELILMPGVHGQQIITNEGCSDGLAHLLREKSAIYVQRVDDSICNSHYVCWLCSSSMRESSDPPCRALFPFESF